MVTALHEAQQRTNATALQYGFRAVHHTFRTGITAYSHRVAIERHSSIRPVAEAKRSDSSAQRSPEAARGVSAG